MEYFCIFAIFFCLRSWDDSAIQDYLSRRFIQREHARRSSAQTKRAGRNSGRTNSWSVSNHRIALRCACDRKRFSKSHYTHHNKRRSKQFFLLRGKCISAPTEKVKTELRCEFRFFKVTNSVECSCGGKCFLVQKRFVSSFFPHYIDQAEIGNCYVLFESAEVTLICTKQTNTRLKFQLDLELSINKQPLIARRLDDQ